MPETAPLFLDFAELAQRLAETRSTRGKIALCAGYLSGLQSDADLDRAVRFLGEGAFSRLSGKRAAVGHRTIAVSAARHLDIDYEQVFRPSRIATGSASEAIEKLLENLESGRRKRREGAPLSLESVDQRFRLLSGARSREDKEALLQENFCELSPLEVKYFLRILGGGSLRIGFELRSILNAIARAFGASPEQVRYTHMITGSLGKTAVMARNGSLDEASFTLFQPVDFMLATALTDPFGQVEGGTAPAALTDFTGFVAEEKFDGMRCQVHVQGEHVALFSRDLNDVTSSFPEVVQFMSGLNLPATVLDGELCVYLDQTIQPFQSLQKRMGVKKPGKPLLQQHPVLFIAFDLLHHDGHSFFGRSLNQRRGLLEALCKENGIARVDQFTIRDVFHLKDSFTQALANGNEGLILKRTDGLYEFGQRGKSWLKVKQPGGSLDTVILYATAGSGKRGGTYSDFTLGIRVSDDPRYEQDFIPIGKAYGGYTDEELKRLNTAIKPLIRERFGPTLSLEPAIVVEIEFDEIQRNKRTKAGYTLRLPRFRAIRWDKLPGQTDTLAEVERLYREKIGRKRQPGAAFSANSDN